jgi:hypothetical protein
MKALIGFRAFYDPFRAVAFRLDHCQLALDRCRSDPPCCFRRPGDRVFRAAHHIIDIAAGCLTHATPGGENRYFYRRRVCFVLTPCPLWVYTRGCAQLRAGLARDDGGRGYVHGCHSPVPGTQAGSPPGTLPPPGPGRFRW